MHVYQHVFLRTSRIVVLGQLKDVVARPTELERLALDRLQDKVLRLVEDPVCELSTQDPNVLGQRADADGIHRVADVDGDRDALLDIQRRAVAAVQAPVLDVVVDEEGVVQQLDRHGRRQCLLDRATKGTAGGDAQRRT